MEMNHIAALELILSRALHASRAEDPSRSERCIPTQLLVQIESHLDSESLFEQ